MNKEQKDHLLQLLKSGKRFDNRKLTEYRKVIVEKGVAKTAEGSARVKIGETEVVAGIKLSVGEPYPDTPDEGSLMVGAEFYPLASPDFEVGPPGIDAIEIARVVDRGIRESHALDVKKLCIKRGEKIWLVSVDICTINAAGGLMDASALATLAALQDARFPSYKDGEIDYKTKTDQKIPLSKIPVSVTVLKLGDNFLVDPSLEEEEAMDGRLTVAVGENGKIYAMQKGGDIPLTVEDVDKMVGIAIEKSAELRKNL